MSNANEQPIVVILSPETILDVYLEYGNLPEEAYEALNKLMSIEEKSVLAELTHIGLEKLNGKIPLELALKAIFATILNLIGLENLNDKMPLEDALKAIFATILNLK